MLEFIKNLHSAEGIGQIIQWGGLFALIGIIFAETGLLVGFFLPGDSLLIAAGMFANPGMKQHIEGLDIIQLNILLFIAAVVGDQVGFYLGTKISDRIWERPDGRFYKRKYMEEAHDFYMRHGGLAIVGARFIPIMRTFVPFAAGVAKMPYKNFVFWNILGGFVWVTSLLWAGYFLGGTRLANSVDKVLVVVVLVSFLPLAFGVVKRWIQGPPAATTAPGAKPAEDGE